MRRVVFHKKSECLLRLFTFLDHGYTPASDDGLVVCGEAARVFFIGNHHLIAVDAEADVRLFLQDIVLQPFFCAMEIESQLFKEDDDEAMYKNPDEI